jgi:hypothetical protein
VTFGSSGSGPKKLSVEAQHLGSDGHRTWNAMADSASMTFLATDIPQFFSAVEGWRGNTRFDQHERHCSKVRDDTEG